MRLKPQRAAIDLLVGAIFLALTVSCLAFKNTNPTELLVAWGWQGDKCILQIINPKNQEFGPVYTQDEFCNYRIVNIQGQPRLVREQRDPRAIVLYTITSYSELVVEKTILVEGVTAMVGSLVPQFGDDETIYLTGILNSATGVLHDRMHILQLDPHTGEITSFIAYEEGTAAFPHLSPRGTHLTYSVFPGLTSYDRCRSHCSWYYHIMDLEANTDINLASRVNHLAANPDFSHCNLQWSPSGRFIAFNVGCESESPQYIIIFNVETNEVVDVIKPIEETFTSNAGLVGWLSNDAIVYGQSVSKQGYESRRFYRYFIYSLSTGTSEELEALPLTNSESLGLTVQDLNWTPDGKWLAADVPSWSEAVAPLLIMEMGSEKVSYIALNTINERPLWSPSGNWIAYTSYEDPDAWSASRNTVKITDRAGEVILDTDVSNITAALNYAWLRP